jgi:hypothetical protein
MTLNNAEIVGLCGLVVSLISIWLQWGLSDRLDQIEDQHKDARINGQQAAAKIRFWKTFAPVLTLTGVALLVYAAFGLFS